MTQNARGVAVETPDGPIEAGAVIACAALQSDRLARRSGVHARTRIVPFRGDYYTLTGAAAGLVRGLVYPVPDPRFPFLGVHFTRKVDDTVVAGPNAVLALRARGLPSHLVRPRDAARRSASPVSGASRSGTGASRRPRCGATFEARVRGRHEALRPGLSGDEAAFGPSGIRAQAMRADGSLVDDFVIEGGGRTMHVLNAPSPGATASLAIGEEFASRALRDLIAPS